ncbi:class II aldolase/adducin family protein [Thermanaerothrix sp. 4228-RoL]|uniref:Class II aldolase/adducin family protein n=1 Tax=Thermanaerothrix solaris TaxID=3058434 RepID=A0ABU3NMT0_9CHLR|nr:class II aldolase/adducin family protein [Thermanaerothrix sp. 4228-RoL]MDT8898154.1 class II aldolase/adducin family protein [Thermanaerothrix sp. 4228-RoL]
MRLKELRERIVEIGNRMVADGLAHGGQGNISALDVESGLIAITPSAVPYHLRQPEDIVVIDLNRQIIEGKWQPTTEIALHMRFYHTRPDVRAVIHTHAPYASVFGIIHEPIPMVLIESATALSGPIPVAPYARPGSEEVAELTQKAMGEEGVACVMAHHGLVTVGQTLEQAYQATLAAETSARMVILARSMGAKVETLDERECKALRQAYLARYGPKPL